MHSSRTRTSRLLTISHSIPCISRGVGVGQTAPLLTPRMQTPWMQIPLETDPLEADSPGHVTCDACWTGGN